MTSCMFVLYFEGTGGRGRVGGGPGQGGRFWVDISRSLHRRAIEALVRLGWDKGQVVCV